MVAWKQRFYWQEWLTEKTPAYQNEPFVDINVINKIIHKFLNWCGRWSVVIIFLLPPSHTPTKWLVPCRPLLPSIVRDMKYCFRIILKANWDVIVGVFNRCYIPLWIIIIKIIICVFISLLLIEIIHLFLYRELY